ncbi:MAG: AAA family ATPase [Vicinamibacterales bacterium]
MDGFDRFTRADALLDAALDLPRAERAAYLDRACAGDRPLRTLLDRLLAAAEAPTGVLATGGALAASPSFIEWLDPDHAGRALNGRYRLVREIGRGGMGTVYEAHDDRLDRAVAVKVLAVQAIDEHTRARFLREVRSAAALNHPGVVAVFDAGEADGWPYLVMELVRGTGLDQAPPADLGEALEIAGQICEALEHVHARGIVHRDLKPGNVLAMRATAGERAAVKLTDLGIALARGAPRVTRSGAIAGTPAFMAPEQALGQPVDGRADLYALGVMLYLWATGRLPFEGDDALAIVSQHIHAPVVPPRVLRPDLPAAVDALILRLLSKSPDDRPSTAIAVREILEAIDADGATEAPLAVAIEGLARGRLVGRRQELDQLRGLWRTAGTDASRLVLVSGEPGVGKTRLARELTAAARLDGALVLAGGCYENEAATPYLPFLEAFRRLAGERDDTALETLLADSAAEIARLAPEIESRLGPFPARPALSPQEERLRLFDHVARFLRRLAGPRGLLFFIDDLQWADHGTLALLHYAVRQLAGERILFLATFREAELATAPALSKMLVDWDREHLATRLRLTRLGREETGRLIGTLLGQAQVADELVTSLYEDTDGNPFFVEEIVKALVAEGRLVHERAAWRRISGEFLLPPSVKAAIGGRLDRVGDRCLELLRTAAVRGKTFDFDEVATAIGGADDLLDAIDDAVAAQLIVAERGGTFAFTHDKIREVLYEGLNPIRRRRLHAKVAAALERLGERTPGDLAVEDLAYHFVEAGDFEKGLHWSERAAEAASGVFAWDEALAMLARARDCAAALDRADDVARLDEAAGDAAMAQADLTVSAGHYERALAESRDPSQRNRVRAKLGEVYSTSGDLRGLAHAQRALVELDPRRRPHETARAMLVEGRYRHLRGDLQGAVDSYRPAVAIAEELGDPALLTRALSALSGTYQHLAMFAESDAAARRCLEMGEERNFPNAVMYGCEFLSENCFYRGQWDACIGFAEREEALAEETQAGERFLWSHFRALALHQAGRLSEADRLCRRGIDAAVEAGERRIELFLRMGLAAVLADLGLIGDASPLAERMVREADEAGLFAHRLFGRGPLALILMRQGRLDDAAREAWIGVELWNSSGSKGGGLIHGASFAEALARSGVSERECVRVLDQHRAIAIEAGADHRLAQNQFVRALIDAREGRPDDAIDRLDEAVATFERCGSTMERIRGLEERASLRQARQPAGAEADLALARTLREASGAAPAG